MQDIDNGYIVVETRTCLKNKKPNEMTFTRYNEVVGQSTVL